MDILSKVLNVIFGLLLIPWVLAIFATFFLFDAPGSEKNILTWSLGLSIWTYPLAYALSLGIANELRKQIGHSPTRAALASLIPLVNFAWLYGAVLALDIFCGGRFDCPK